VIGIRGWTASTTAISKAGWYPGTVGSPGGNLVPIAVSLSALPKGTNQNIIVCPTGDPPIPGAPGSKPCVPIPMTNNTGGNITPGQFAWMSWSGAGSTSYTCDPPNNGGILGPPGNSPTYPQIPSNTWITVPGNTGVSNACKSNIAAWVNLHTTVVVPIVSPGPGPCPTGCFPGSSVPYPPQSQGTGSSTTYNVIGFAGFEITGCRQAFGVGNGPCIDEIWGVFRQVLFAGPGGSTPGTNGVNGAFLGIELVK
jgi:hypothetical protein